MAFETIPLSHGIRSRFVANNSGLTMHVLEAGSEEQNCPCVLAPPRLSGTGLELENSSMRDGFYHTRRA